MSMRISWIEGLKFKTEHRGLEIITDVYADEPEGMSPGALMMASLGTCMGSRLVDQMNKRGWEVGGVEVTVKYRSNKELRTATSFDLDIRLEADLTEDQREEIFEEAKICFVANTLKGAPEINYSLTLV
jgi:putative redox protein